MNSKLASGCEVIAPVSEQEAHLLSPSSLRFLSHLHHLFEPRRRELLKLRTRRQEGLNAGHLPAFLKETAQIRKDDSWQVAETPPDLERRYVEITGPTDRKMMINALNSGADVFMADFEDSLSPTWHNVISGQQNLCEAVEGNLTFQGQEGKSYALNEQRAVLFVRPRGWHLVEKHFLVDGEPMSASLFDFGLFFFHNADKLIQSGSGPYFYLPKLESHLEARLWNEVFVEAQKYLGIPHGSIRATVLIETILAAFEMEEILYELRDHSCGLNAGRWDYTFSIIKKFQWRKHFVFPDRGQITMTVPFMRAYTELLIRTCHKRGAHAMGGMAAFIPSRKDQAINEVAIKKVTEDKQRESKDGFDGTWVAHPDLVNLAQDVFKQALKGKPHQKDRLREDVNVIAEQLLNFNIPDGKTTEAGIRQNINVALLYLNSWLQGVGAAAIYNLMEDTATAEISRAQLWQWLHHGTLTKENYIKFTDEEFKKCQELVGEGKLSIARKILDDLVLNNHFVDFLTIPAYEYLN